MRKEKTSAGDMKARIEARKEEVERKKGGTEKERRRGVLRTNEKREKLCWEYESKN